MRTIALAGALFLALAACGPAAMEQARMAGPLTTMGELPPGTTIVVALTAPLSAERDRAGETVTAEVVEPVVGVDGMIVGPVGTVLNGTITGVATPRGPGNQVAIGVHFHEMMVRDRAVPIDAQVVQVDMHIADGDRPASTNIVGSDGYMSFGGIMSTDLALTHTGIEFAPESGTVITLGMGDVEAELPAGTRLVLTNAGSALAP